MQDTKPALQIHPVGHHYSTLVRYLEQKDSVTYSN